MLREHRPDLMAVHLIALDGTEHRDGPWVDSRTARWKRIDAMVGELAAAALANDPDGRVAVVSDHGFIATHTAVNLRVPFVAAGLITLAPPPAVGRGAGDRRLAGAALAGRRHGGRRAARPQRWRAARARRGAARRAARATRRTASRAC